MASTDYFGFNTTQEKTLRRLMDSDDAGLAALATSVSNLNAWATALATQLNANGGAGTGYDTDPQA